MITAKPFKRKGLRAQSVLKTTYSALPQDSADTLPVQSEHDYTQESKEEEVKKISPPRFTGYRTPEETKLLAKETALESKVIPIEPKEMTRAIFCKLVIGTVAGTGGVTAMHCHHLIEEFMRRYNWKFSGYFKPPYINGILQELYKKGEVDKLLINNKNYYFKLK